MDDSRRYLRLVCDKILKQNILSTMLEHFVKFYYTMFLHPLKILKFEKNMPINKNVDYQDTYFDNTEKRTNILG